MRWIAAIAIALLWGGWSSKAEAWGNTAHRLVCEIAVHNLTPAARAEVSRLLQATPETIAAAPRLGDYGWACTWPDNPRPGGPGRRSPEHFATFPRTMPEVTGASPCGSAPLCVTSGILADLATLRERSRSDGDRAWAMIYLGHWVADSHQPLHNSFQDDQGGNEITSTGLCTRSLHSSWDTCILQARALGADATPEAVRELAVRWSAQAGAAERRQWRESQPWQWSAESYAIARRPELGYCVRVGQSCHYSATQETHAAGQPRRSVAVDAAYLDWAMPVIQQRLTQAGIRLAHLLNRALDPGYRG